MFKNKRKYLNLILINSLISKDQYLNDLPNPIETEFVFSITPDISFHDFKAKIDDKIIKVIIKEKNDAKTEYNISIKKVNTTAYSQIVSEFQDVIKKS